MLVVRPLIEEQKPKGKAFLLTGKFSPYTIGHHEVARQTAAHAAESGYTHFYHGIGGASKQTESDPFTHAQKTKVIRAAHKELAKAHPSVKFRTTKKEQLGPFHQLTHLAKQGHKHITVGLAAGHKLKGEIEGWVKKNKGIKDETGKVHDVKVDFHQLGAERQEGEMPRHEVLGRLKQGDIRVAKATRLRKAVASGDTELAHELMPKHMDKPQYQKMIQNAQSKIPAKKTRKKKLTEGLLSFSEFIAEDIELIPVQRDRHAEKPRKAADVHKGYSTKNYSNEKIVTKKNLGEIHPGYDLHHHSRIAKDPRGRDVLRHQFTIVHRASGDVAGEMNAKGGKLHPTKGVVPGPKGKGLKVTHLEVHPDHSSKKVGKSLAVEMYRHLHRRGHAIQSDAIQSHGAAHVWNTMRNDRELKKHMMIHSNREPLRGELHTFEKRAHRRPERHIWYQHSRNWSAGQEKVEGSHGDEPDEVRTLVLSGKKQRKKMNEAPELDAYIDPGGTKKESFNVSYLKKKRHTFDSKSFVGHKRMGDIHPKYEMWRHTTELTDDKGNKYHQHQFSIVHKDTRKKVGEIDAVGGKINRKTGEHRAGTGKDLKISYLGIHDQHSAKKVGTSLAVAAYKHLHKKGRSIKSDTRQSFGGAHVWDTLRNDPEVKRHVKFHDERDNTAIPAHKLPYGGIWQENPSASDTTLVLHKKRKKKVVAEDIEMSNVMGKPWGGFHRDFSRVVYNPWTKKPLDVKRSGRIAKGYTLHTIQDPDDLRIQRHYIVHDATNHVAGDIHTHSSPMTGEHHVVSTEIHGDHTQKKIGKSLAMLAYKHLARKKGNLHSSNLQSPGGASIWNRLRKDPRMKGKIFHKSKSGQEVPAHDLTDKQIWASETKVIRSKGTPQYLPKSSRHAEEHEKVLLSRLVIRPAKKS